MNPQQPYGSYPPAPSSNPYDFITVAPPKPPRTSRGLGEGSMLGKLVFVFGGAIVLIIVVVFIVNAIFGNKTNFAPMLELAQTQQEIIRTSQQSSVVADQALAGAAINTRFTMYTQQHTLVDYLAKHKQKTSTKILGLKKDAQTDAQFQQAKATSTFDLVFTQVLRQELTDYANSISRVYKNAPGPEAKKILQAEFKQTAMLLQQWPTTAPDQPAAEPTTDQTPTDTNGG